jgi:hypothetical protein
VKRDFVAAGVPARTFAVVIAAVRFVKHPAVPEDTSNMVLRTADVKGGFDPL